MRVTLDVHLVDVAAAADAGIHVLRGADQAHYAGTSSIRIIVASIRIADAMPMPTTEARPSGPA